jgi:opacity protein-like surface antigen
MRNLLFTAVLAFGAASPAAAADNTQCAAGPFTLNKPAPTPEPRAAADHKQLADAAAAKPKPAAKPRPKAKERLLATCKSGKPAKHG